MLLPLRCRDICILWNSVPKRVADVAWHVRKRLSLLILQHSHHLICIGEHYMLAIIIFWRLHTLTMRPVPFFQKNGTRHGGCASTSARDPSAWSGSQVTSSHARHADPGNANAWKIANGYGRTDDSVGAQATSSTSCLVRRCHSQININI